MKKRSIKAAVMTAFLAASVLTLNAWAEENETPEILAQDTEVLEQETPEAELPSNEDVPLPTEEEPAIIDNAGWNELSDGGLCYISREGEMLTGYQTIDNEEYYFSAKGKAKCGFYTINDVRMFFSPDTFKRVYGWAENGGELYYLEAEGKAQGWRTIEGREYYFDQYGKSVNGWFEYDGSKYYQDRELGVYTGECTIDGETYLFSSKGRFISGWVDINGKRLFYDYDTQKPVYGAISYNGYFYYCDEQYGKATGDKTINGIKYRFDDMGCQQLGMQKFSDGTRYYSSDGKPYSGFIVLEGKKYYFSDKNYLMQTGLISAGGKKYYMDSSGVMQTGWQTVSGSRYYFDTSGEMLTDRLMEYKGSFYALGTDGKMVTGWYTKNGEKRYFGKDGKMVTGLQTIEGKKYLFRSSEDGWNDSSTLGTLIVDAPYYVNWSEKNGKYISTVYRIDKNGVVQTEDDLLNKVKGAPSYSFTVENKQGGSSWTNYITDNDVSILKEFADRNFTKNMTGAEKIRTTLDWIHYNVKYAENEDWNEIASCTFVDAIFRHKKGQCAQYNGALISMMNWLGYDSRLILGYRGYWDNKWQHFWGEVTINGKKYIMETGNEGRNGSWQYFLTEVEYTSGYVY